MKAPAEKDGSANSDNTVKSNEQASGFDRRRGDPLIQHEAVAKMAEFAQSKNVPTYLESSCFDAERFSHVLPFIDIVKIEFKTVESGFVPPEQHPKLFAQALECLTRSISASKKTYVKIVVSSKTNLADFESMLADIFTNKAALKILGLIIQPTHRTKTPSPNADVCASLHCFELPASSCIDAQLALQWPRPLLPVNTSHQLYFL